MITRNRILFIVGILIVLLPFLGFPTSYKTVFNVIFGLTVVFLAFLYARDKRMTDHSDYSRRSPSPESDADVYVQNQPVPEHEDEERFSEPDSIRGYRGYSAPRPKTPVN